VGRFYVNREIPFVFSGVNAAPEIYGYPGSRNITGVMEHEHFVESVRLLKAIVPGAEKIAVILDQDPMWEPVVARMKGQLNQLPQVRFVSWDIVNTFSGFREKMRTLQTQADAVALIGIFGFKDESGSMASSNRMAAIFLHTAKRAREPPSRSTSPAYYGVLEAGIEFLGKPFTSLGVLRKVRQVLDAREHPRASQGSSLLQ
jgi:hypothetical protein